MDTSTKAPTAILALVGSLLAAEAFAADLAETPSAPPPTLAAWHPFELRIGAAGILFDESAKVSLGGARVPGGNGRLADNVGVSIEAAYHFTPNWSAALTLGYPPTTTLSGAGTLQGAGKLGDVTYGPAVAAVRYHFTNIGPFVPYVGVGVNYAIIFATKSRFLHQIRVDNGIGPVINAGFDVPITDRYGLFVDVKKIWLDTDAKFNNIAVPGAAIPGRAKLTLDPLVVTSGLSVRF